GDANRGPDEAPVSAEAIRGQVWFHVPYLGAVRDSLQGRAGLSLLAVLLLGGYALSQLVGGVRQGRAARAGRTGTPAAGPELEPELRIDRPLVVARFDRERLADEGLDPQAAAREWNGVVAADGADGIVLLFCPEPELAALLLDVLALHHADQVRELAGPH